MLPSISKVSSFVSQRATYSGSCSVLSKEEERFLMIGKGVRGLLLAKYSVAVNTGGIFVLGVSSTGGLSGGIITSSSERGSGDGVSRNTLRNCSS